MGIDVFVFDFLLDLKGRDLGDVLCLGRQGFHVSQNAAAWARARQIMSHRFPADDPDKLIQPDGYSETFLHYLGARTINSLDLLPQEGATVICDLNEPVSPSLHDRFDLILDAGTLEHVYNFPVAIQSVKAMLRVGGVFVSINGANNWLGHGLYQFSPDLFWQVFSAESGFIVDSMALVPLDADPNIPTRLPQTYVEGRRQEIGSTNERTYLMLAARRQRTDIRTGNVYQSDYGAVLKAPSA